MTGEKKSSLRRDTCDLCPLYYYTHLNVWIYFTYYLYTSTLSMFCLKVLVCLRVIHIYIYTCICFFFIPTGYVHNTWILYICSCAPAGLRQTAAFHWSYQFMSWASLCWWPLMALCDALFQWRYLLLGLRNHTFVWCLCRFVQTWETCPKMATRCMFISYVDWENESRMMF